MGRGVNLRLFVISTIAVLLSFSILSSADAAPTVASFYWSERDNAGAQIQTADVGFPAIHTPVITSNTVYGAPYGNIDDVEIDPLAGNLWWNNWTPGPGNAGVHEGIYSSPLNGTPQLQVTGTGGQFDTTHK